MINKKLRQARHNLHELSEWSDQDLETLIERVEKLKSPWDKAHPEFDSLLILGAALSWSEESHQTPGLPTLNKAPSDYIEVGHHYREQLQKQAKSLCEKAQAWGGFWDPEDEKKEDKNGWAERESSIAPHVWIGLKKKGFLPHINTPLEYERESLKGLEECCTLFLKLPKLCPSLENLQKAHQTLFKNISNTAGEFTNTQLFTGGYIGADPRLIPYEIQEANKEYQRGINASKKMGNFKEAEIIRTVVFTCAKLLRIQPFVAGNKRIIAAWALCILSREINLPKIEKINFWKDLHLTFKDLRKGKLASTCKKLCKAFDVENPEIDVPSFWLSPGNVAPKQIEPKEWENQNSAKGKGKKIKPSDKKTELLVPTI
jgi:fido (protein-threonine AMPylation protein)